MGSITYVPGELENIIVDIVGKHKDEAQRALDERVMQDMIPYMPVGEGPEAGNLIRQTQQRSAALAGTGTVCAATTIYGRYQWFGMKMKHPITGKGPRPIMTEEGLIFRWPAGIKLAPSTEPLTYHGNPNTEPQWFFSAKRDHYEEWKALAKEVMINGRK